METHFTAEEEAQFKAAVERAIAQADRGEFISEEEMDVRISQMLERQR
jgi:predicted transcriptional regulator